MQSTSTSDCALARVHKSRPRAPNTPFQSVMRNFGLRKRKRAAEPPKAAKQPKFIDDSTLEQQGFRTWSNSSGSMGDDAECPRNALYRMLTDSEVSANEKIEVMTTFDTYTRCLERQIELARTQLMDRINRCVADFVRAQQRKVYVHLAKAIPTAASRNALRRKHPEEYGDLASCQKWLDQQAETLVCDEIKQETQVPLHYEVLAQMLWNERPLGPQDMPGEVRFVVPDMVLTGNVGRPERFGVLSNSVREDRILQHLSSASGDQRKAYLKRVLPAPTPKPQLLTVSSSRPASDE